MPVSSLDEAIELANSTRFGLGANIYTGDLKTVLRCMREIKSGTVWFNDPLTDNDAGPFGGFKQSGMGRELGREGLEAFQETKHVHIETEIGSRTGGIRTRRAAEPLASARSALEARDRGIQLGRRVDRFPSGLTTTPVSFAIALVLAAH